MRRSTMVASGALLALSTMLLACGDGYMGVGNQGELVGGPCSSAPQHCAGGADCLTGGDFPAGTCSVRCNSDADCPADTACVDKDGGHCLLTCAFSNQCRGGYQCKGVKRRDRSGEVLVCIE